MKYEIHAATNSDTITIILSGAKGTFGGSFKVTQKLSKNTITFFERTINTLLQRSGLANVEIKK